MLDWLSGKALDDSDDSSRDEPPETPAHLFAVKAFKSALFGTPAPPAHSEYENESDQDATATSRTRTKATTFTQFLPKLSNPQPSPAKGILLAPGSVPTRRKTVTFDAVKQHTQTIQGNSQADTGKEKHGEPQHDLGFVQHKEVRRSLFSAEKPLANPRKQTNQLNERLKGQADDQVQDSVEDAGDDFTTDLQQPRSTSGKHWMEAYHRDHNMSKIEMKKLIKYSQMSKDHAARRDREATRLKEKLQKSEDRVKGLEEKVRRMEQSVGQRDSKNHTHSKASSDRASLDPQISELQKISKGALEKATKLERENENFKMTIMRVKEEMAKYEARHKEWVAQRKRKDQRYAEQRTALKEKIVLQKTQYAELLRETEERAEREKRSLLKEIEFLRGEVSSASPAKFALPEFAARKEPVLESSKDIAGKTRAKQLQVSELKLNGGSSPTILDHHLAKATASSSKTNSFPKPHVPLPRITAVRQELQTQSSKSPLDMNGLDLDVAVEADDTLPAVLPATRNLRPAARARKAVRVVKPSGGLKGRSASGLPPDREAAARMRIAQRSVEKQRDARFLFDDTKENREPLSRRLVNG